MSKDQFEQDLAHKLSGLKGDRQPERDLWPGIELAISQQNIEWQQPAKAMRFKGAAMAASVVVLVLIGWLNIGQQPARLTGDALVASLTQQHQQQKHALLVRFEAQPALTENWQSQLTELDAAADAIKKALSNEPNNMALLKMLQNVHQQQISLIERVHAPKWSTFQSPSVEENRI